MKNMSFITIKEFQRLSLLSDAAVLWLLKESKLRLILDEKRGLLIDPKSASEDLLIKSITEGKTSLIDTNEGKELVDKVCSEIMKRLVNVFEDVFSDHSETPANNKD